MPALCPEGENITEIPSIFLEFITISSFNNCVISIRILKGNDESELNHIIKKPFP
jgi:virulence-associated protein VapD